MSPLLRSPHVVPSLFSQGADADEPVPPRPNLSQRAMACCALCWALLISDSDTVAGRCSRALAGSSVVVLIMGKPLCKAALVVGIALVH